MWYIGACVVVVFEGCDVVGKGSIIKRIIEYFNFCVVRIVVLFVLMECERS